MATWGSYFASYLSKNAEGTESDQLSSSTSSRTDASGQYSPVVRLLPITPENPTPAAFALSPKPLHPKFNTQVAGPLSNRLLDSATSPAFSIRDNAVTRQPSPLSSGAHLTVQTHQRSKSAGSQSPRESRITSSSPLDDKVASEAEDTPSTKPLDLVAARQVYPVVVDRFAGQGASKNPHTSQAENKRTEMLKPAKLELMPAPLATKSRPPVLLEKPLPKPPRSPHAAKHSLDAIMSDLGAFEMVPRESQDATPVMQFPRVENMNPVSSALRTSRGPKKRSAVGSLDALMANLCLDASETNNLQAQVAAGVRSVSNNSKDWSRTARGSGTLPQQYEGSYATIPARASITSSPQLLSPTVYKEPPRRPRIDTKDATLANTASTWSSDMGRPNIHLSRSSRPDSHATPTTALSRSPSVFSTASNMSYLSWRSELLSPYATTGDDVEEVFRKRVALQNERLTAESRLREMTGINQTSEGQPSPTASNDKIDSESNAQSLPSLHDNVRLDNADTWSRGRQMSRNNIERETEVSFGGLRRQEEGDDSQNLNLEPPGKVLADDHVLHFRPQTITPEDDRQLYSMHLLGPGGRSGLQQMQTYSMYGDESVYDDEETSNTRNDTIDIGFRRSGVDWNQVHLEQEQASQQALEQRYFAQAELEQIRYQQEQLEAHRRREEERVAMEQREMAEAQEAERIDTELREAAREQAEKQADLRRQEEENEFRRMEVERRNATQQPPGKHQHLAEIAQARLAAATARKAAIANMLVQATTAAAGPTSTAVPAAVVTSTPLSLAIAPAAAQPAVRASPTKAPAAPPAVPRKDTSPRQATRQEKPVGEEQISAQAKEAAAVEKQAEIREAEAKIRLAFADMAQERGQPVPATTTGKASVVPIDESKSVNRSKTLKVGVGNIFARRKDETVKSTAAENMLQRSGTMLLNSRVADLKSSPNPTVQRAESVLTRARPHIQGGLPSTPRPQRR